MIIPNIWENKKCSKPPTRQCRGALEGITIAHRASTESSNPQPRETLEKFKGHFKEFRVDDDMMLMMMMIIIIITTIRIANNNNNRNNYTVNNHSHSNDKSK